MRIAVVVPGDLRTRSGGFRYDRRLIASLRDAGDVADAIEVPRRRYPVGLVDNIAPPSLAEYDLVVEDELAHPGLYACNRRLRAAGTPVVALVHHLRRDATGGIAGRVAGALERRYLAGVDAAVCPSEAVRASVRACADRPCLVAPPPGDQFDPDVTDAEIERRAAEGPLRIAFLGNVVPRKRVGVLLDALCDLGAPWELAVVGSTRVAPTYTSRLRARARRRGVADRVAFRGSLPASETAAVLRRSHVFAMPSRYEGFGIAYLEAMGFGLPVVATAAGGASDLVEPSTGALVPPDDAEAIRTALAAFATDRSGLARAGVAARRRYERHPPWSAVAAEIRDFLGWIREVAA